MLAGLREAFRPLLEAESQGPKGVVRPDRAFRLVTRAEELMDRRVFDGPLSTSELAADLGVSDRTLHRAFKRWVGVGPYDYQLVRRLHHFRRRLLTGAPYRGKITDAAIRSGFDHFGRLAQHYRRRFGELPSETVKRLQSEHSSIARTRQGASF